MPVGDESVTAIKMELQKSLTILDEIEKWSADSRGICERSEYIARLKTESDELRRRTERNLVEIAEKLKHLIG